MPTYRYQCSKCGEEIERFQSFSDKPLTRHSGCGGKLQKVFGSVGIVLKGPGFYRTDNRSGSRTRASNGSSRSGSDSPNGSEGSGAAKPSGEKKPAKEKPAPTTGSGGTS